MSSLVFSHDRQGQNHRQPAVNTREQTKASIMDIAATASPSGSPASPEPLTPPLAGAGESRFFGLDAVRAAAMLLGVLYHAIMFGGGMMGGFGRGTPSAANRVMDWIHTFRMPLFFLISGFFCHMMLKKYGLGRYLAKRWVRIGVPFLLVLFVLGFVRSQRGSSGFPGGGGPPGGGPRMGPGNGPPGFGAGGEMPAPPPGFVPPFLEKFDKDKDGSLGAQEWKEAQGEMRKMFEQGGPPGKGPAAGPPGMMPEGEPPGRTGPPGFGPEGMQGRPGGGGFPRGGPMMPFGQSNPISESLFGGFSRNLSLQHLWFLWYLLVFATAAPLVSMTAGRLISKIAGPKMDSVSRTALCWGVAPVGLAAVSVLGMWLAGAAPGRPPGGMMGIFGTFPDVFFRYDPDWPYFFTYFLAGWWLYRNRSGLNDLARLWLPILALGFIAHLVSNTFASPNPFGGQPTAVDGAALGKYFIFGLSAACTGFGLLGLFQRYVNRPARVTRYLADTAFWIYLVHQDLLNMVVIPATRGWSLPTLLQAILNSLITCGIALIAFELIIRRTPLTNLFGPPRKTKRAAGQPVTTPAQA